VDVSFILSSDELYTLISLAPQLSNAGQQFYTDALSGAIICDLSGLVEKKLAHRIEDEIDVEPVLKMISDAISKADSIETENGVWKIKSPWVALVCERYIYHENHWRITPVKDKEAESK